MRSASRGAIQTDFILSAEIIVITLGTVATAPLMTRIGVLTAIVGAPFFFWLVWLERRREA